MKNITSTTEREVLWQWARAEIESRRFAAIYPLPAHLITLIRAGKKDALTPEEWRDLEQHVRGARLPILAGLLQLGTRWYSGTLAFTELPNLRVMNWPPFLSLAPHAGSLSSLTRSTAGKDPPAIRRSRKPIGECAPPSA